MEFIEYAFPEIEEVKAMDTTQQQCLISEIAEMSDYKDQVLTVLLEQKIFQTLEDYKPNISKVIVHPSYTYDNTGYEFKNAMVWVDNFVDPSGTNTKEAKFQAALDLKLVDLAPLMKNVSEFDTFSLISKYGQKPDPVNEPNIQQPGKKRYDM